MDSVGSADSQRGEQQQQQKTTTTTTTKLTKKLTWIQWVWPTAEEGSVTVETGRAEADCSPTSPDRSFVGGFVGGLFGGFLGGNLGGFLGC